MNDPKNSSKSGDAASQARIKLSPAAAQRVRRQRSDSEGPRMLPGMAMIAIFLLVYSVLNVFGAYKGVFGYGIGRYAVLTICTMFAVGVFGFLRLRRWGWALLLGGSLFVAIYYVVQFIRAHMGIAQGFTFLVWSAFFTIFFLYLVRDEVRERVH